MSRSLHEIAALLLTFLVLPSADSQAQPVVCSKDGSALLSLASRQRPGETEWHIALEKQDLVSGATQVVPVSPAVDLESAVGLARTEPGELLLLTSAALWSIDPGTGATTSVCPVPEEVDAGGIAHDPVTSVTVTWAALGLGDECSTAELWVLPKGGKKFRSVGHRRTSHFWGMTFLPDGRLVFSASGDLWVGSLVEDEGDDRWDLEAERFCPLAYWETYSGTGASFGAQHMVALGDRLIVHTGHRGIGLLTVPIPPVPDGSGSEFAPITAMGKSLAAVRFLGSSGSSEFLCSSPDGKTAWFELYLEAGGKRVHSMRVKGKPRPLDWKIE